MNLTQNDRLKQVTSDTLIVGVDVGSQTHFCRAFDWRGFEFSRRVFKFSNTGMGFLTFLRWTEEIMNKTEMKKVIVGCEPTGCYWLTFQKFLQDHDVQLVTVNPFTVNRSMELDDNSPEKSDLKDPKTIALLVKDGRFSTSYLPSGVYAEIREASVCRDQIMKEHVRLSNQIQGWLQKFFPEYFECYADWDSTSGLMLLREVPLPQDILKIGAGGINQIWRDAKALPLMIELMKYGYEHCDVVILEGIMYDEWYSPLFKTANELYGMDIYAYYFDIPFEETVRRHNTRDKKQEFGEEDMRRWWREKDFSSVFNEKIITSDIDADSIVEMIYIDSANEG